MPFKFDILFSFIIFHIFLIQAFDFISVNTDKELPQFTDPCSLIKCSQEEICVTKDESKAICVAKNLLEVNENHLKMIKRANSKKIQYCGTSECRFGECEIRNSTSFICHCYKGVTGDYCNMLDITGLSCASNPCYGDSFCIDLAGNAICVCEEGRIGPQCMDIVGECNCQNDAKCVNQLVGSFRCECKDGFGGELCQYKIDNLKRPCSDNDCLNGGICNNKTNTCECTPEFKGKRCELSMPKLSTTTKKTLSNFLYTKFTLPKAQTTQYNIEICSEKTCLNGGTCIQLDHLSAICLCTANYNGPYCNLESKFDPLSVTEPLSTNFPIKKSLTSTNKTTTTLSNESSNEDPILSSPTPRTLSDNSTVQKLQCPSNIPNPCMNNGICEYQGNFITCKCSPTYTGTFCTEREQFCLNEPCMNGGVCNQIGKYDGQCTCKSKFSGEFCEVGLECNPNPCKNDQPCLLIDGSPRCFCTAAFSPPFCD